MKLQATPTLGDPKIIDFTVEMVDPCREASFDK